MMASLEFIDFYSVFAKMYHQENVKIGLIRLIKAGVKGIVSVLAYVRDTIIAQIVTICMIYVRVHVTTLTHRNTLTCILDSFDTRNKPDEILKA